MDLVTVEEQALPETAAHLELLRRSVWYHVEGGAWLDGCQQADGPSLHCIARGDLSRDDILALAAARQVNHGPTRLFDGALDCVLESRADRVDVLAEVRQQPAGATGTSACPAVPTACESFREIAGDRTQTEPR
jgi:hypothetical protein